MNTKVNNSSLEFKPPIQAGHTVAVSTTAVTLTAASLPSSHQYVYIQVQTNTVRATYDGSDPTASNGEQLVAGTRLTVKRDLAVAMKFIRESADATLWVQPFGV